MLQTCTNIIRVKVVHAQWPTPMTSEIKRNVQRTESGELALMNVVHRYSVKLDFRGRVSMKMKEGGRKKTHSTI